MGLSSVIALAGPQKELQGMNLPPEMYKKIHRFYTPEDHGEFPDTSGYTREDWASISSSMEDSQLWPHMQKCMDAVLDFVLKKGTVLDKLGAVNIKTSVQWPKSGGKIFAVVGFVSWQPILEGMGRGIKVARG